MDLRMGEFLRPGAVDRFSGAREYQHGLSGVERKFPAFSGIASLRPEATASGRGFRT